MVLEYIDSKSSGSRVSRVSSKPGQISVWCPCIKVVPVNCNVEMRTKTAKGWNTATEYYEGVEYCNGIVSRGGILQRNTITGWNTATEYYQG